MNVIGHRGAANIAPENTILGIETAMKAGVDAVEFDIRVSKDLKLATTWHTSKMLGENWYMCLLWICHRKLYMEEGIVVGQGYPND